MYLLPENISSFGGEIDSLIGFISAIAAVVLFLAETALLGIVIFFRRKPGRSAPYIKGMGWRQMRWVLLPVAAVVVLDLLIDLKTHKAWNAVMQSLPSKGMRVRITGSQYRWSFAYPGADGLLGTADDIVRVNDFAVPVDSNVIFDLAAADMIHSFWVPSLRFKQDAVPGRIITRWFKAIKTGTYGIACAELCGVGHSDMKATLRVESREDFLRDLQSGVNSGGAEVRAPAGGAENRGAELLNQKGCTACHTLDGSKLVGPSYKGIFGRKTKLADGREIVVDAAYLRRSIREPEVDQVAGFPAGLMPKLPLSDEEIHEVVEYLETLR